jgi:RecJ-like exonuclease
MSQITCIFCKGTGFVKKIKQEYCINNTDKLSSHLCCKCENIRGELKGLYSLCKKCHGDGYFVKITKNHLIS